MPEMMLVRPAPTIYRWRLAEPSDIQAGQEFQMIDHDLFLLMINDNGIFMQDPAFIGTTIRLLDDPVRKRPGFSGIFVFYSHPGWQAPCFVPASSFLKMKSGRSDEYEFRPNHYWIPMD